MLIAFSDAAASDTTIDDTVAGIWITADGDSMVEIRIQDDLPSGFVAGTLNDPENHKPPEFDEKNPDPALQGRPLLGLQILHSFRSSGRNMWKGRVYDPSSGKTYKCKLTFVDANTLKIRGYFGIPLLGKTQVWTRHYEYNSQ